jgi:lipase chaperone LimK
MQCKLMGYFLLFSIDLDSVTWENLERSCLDAQLTGISLNPELEEHMASFKQLIQLRNEFMALTSPAVERLTDHAFQGHVHQVLQDLIRRIFSTVDGEAFDHSSIRAKLSYNVLRFLIEYCVKPSRLSEEYMRKFRKLADFPKLQAFETYMIEYSDILQKAYVELGRTVQRSPDRELREKYRLGLLNGRYLVDMDKTEQPSLISLGKNKDTNMQTPELDSLEIINELKKEIELVSDTLQFPNQYEYGVESKAQNLAVALGIY